MSPTDCAVIFKHRETSATLTPNGQSVPTDEATCVVFDRLEAAQQYCEAKVQSLTGVRCEVYDANGLARPPLLIVVQRESQDQQDTGSVWSPRRKLIAAALILLSLPLFWMGSQERSSSDVLIFLGINCVLAALRFIYWDFGIRHRERERRKRVDQHRKIERGDA